MIQTLQIGPFGLPDIAAFVFALALWLLIGWVIEHPPANRPSVSRLMERYRQDWMAEFVTRQPRIFDATMIDSLRQGTAFFASASMIAIGGGIALIGNPAMLSALTRDLALTSALTGLQMRVGLVVAFLANALLKFIWAHRLFGYCSIMMAAVPNDPKHPNPWDQLSIHLESLCEISIDRVAHPRRQKQHERDPDVLLAGRDRPNDDRYQQNASQRNEIRNTQGNPCSRAHSGVRCRNSVNPSGRV